jgi:hypothetical protein
MRYPLFLRAYNSPFRPPKLKWYFGKTAVGVPIFLPRKWVVNKEKPGYLKTIPLKVGFSFCDLMWKTKWQRDDYRFEHSPVLSLVFFGYQIAITFVAIEFNHYWECFIPYYFETDKKLSVRERIKDCRERYPCVWTSYTDGAKETVDYYNLILKNKYL